MAASIISDQTCIRFRKTQNLIDDPIIEIDLYGNSSAVITSKSEAARMVEALTRAAYTIHKLWSKNLE
jgi:hypothetical protein